MECKVCIKCNLNKPLSQFSKNPKCKDGHARSCKHCEKVTVSKRTGSSKKHFVDRYVDHIVFDLKPNDY